MIKEIILSERGTLLRKNDSQELKISINQTHFSNLYLINGKSFITKNLSESDFTIKPHDYYMIINKDLKNIEIDYNLDISNHEIIYDPYIYKNSEKINIKPEDFQQKYKIPDGYIDTLPKWYSFKFTYPDYNLIFVKPEMGLSIQIHKNRNEMWEILEGKPIIISGNKVYYYVKNGTKFRNLINTFHSIINPNKDREQFAIIKERWSGKFYEKDIKRVFNPNQYT
jgi:mannose-6-phosphate isomerase-like protein (cupin superfamily)